MTKNRGNCNDEAQILTLFYGLWRTDYQDNRLICTVSVLSYQGELLVVMEAVRIRHFHSPQSIQHVNIMEKLLVVLVWTLLPSVILSDCGDLTDFLQLPDFFPPPQQFTATEGVITSLDFPGSLPDDIICTFTIRGPIGSTITTRFNVFTLDFEEALLYFYLNDDVFIEQSMRVVPTPGEALPAVFTTPSNFLGITIVTSNETSIVKGAFRLSYRINPPVNTSRLILDSDDTTTILAILSVIASVIAIVANAVFF